MAMHMRNSWNNRFDADPRNDEPDHQARLVSICIPTRNRPALLREALASCAAQDYAPIEILIGDDSTDDAAAQVVRAHVQRHGGVVRYERNTVALGQAGNVNRLFARAQGARLVLLHDDDLLEPTALTTLDRCWARWPELTAAFGKQLWIDNDGTVLPQRSAQLNRFYQRVAENAGLQQVPAVAGISRMFPNNAYMVRSAAARAVGYRPVELVGEACDFDFGLRLCLDATALCYVDEHVARYRITDESVSRSAFPALCTYQILSNIAVPEAARGALSRALAQIAPLAASAYARSGRPRDALRVMCSGHYRLRDKFRARFAYHLYLLYRAATTRHAAGRTAPLS